MSMTKRHLAKIRFAAELLAEVFPSSSDNKLERFFNAVRLKHLAADEDWAASCRAAFEGAPEPDVVRKGNPWKLQRDLDGERQPR